jgi:ubiquinone/menaquinone biosynthesis C-methylase UbiE
VVLVHSSNICLFRYHKYWIGLESRLYLFETVRNKYTDVDLRDFCQLPIKTGGIQNVLCSAVLKHVYYLEEAITEVKRVLNPSGLFFMTIPMEKDFLWNTGRTLSTQRIWHKKGINYKKFISIEHCNTTKEII